MKLEERFDGNATSVTIYFKNIAVIDANEGSKIYSETNVKESSLELRAQEGGKIDIAVAAKI